MDNHLFGLLCLVFLEVVEHGTNCPVEITPSSLALRHGARGRASCHASVPVESIGWASSYYNMSSTGLTSLDWSEEDGVDWNHRARCFIVPKEGDSCSKDLPILVYQMPVEVKITGPSSPKVEGQPYEFFCTLKEATTQPNLTVRWFKGDKFAGEEILGTSDPHPRKLIETSTIFTFSKEDDGKMCYCEASLDVDSEHPVRSNSLTITVHYPPAPMVDEYWLTGRDITLDCTATSNPPPTYTWTSKFTLEDLGTQPRIRVSQVDEYTCTATNPLGSANKTFAVSDPEMPVEVELSGPSLPMVEGETYVFFCTVKKATTHPNPTEKWLKCEKFAGEDILETSDILPLDLIETLNILFLSREDDGKICYCEAGFDVESEHPVRSNSLAITVHYPPDTMEDVVLDLRSDTVLDCTITCNPPPTYTWTSTSTQEDLGTQPRITVTKAGNYTCTATNTMGSATKHFMVKYTSSGTFWAVLGVGIGVAVVVIAGYRLYRLRADPNSII